MATTMTKDVFLRDAARLTGAVGDCIGAFDDRARDIAEHAVVGDICPDFKGNWYHVGFDKINWTCSDSYNIENAQMSLQRFHMLAALAPGYRTTRDERYATTARRYIEAYLRDHRVDENWEPIKPDGATQFDLRVGCYENPGWLGTLSSFLSSASFDDDLFHRMIDACRMKLRYLTTHIFPDRNIRVLHGEVLITNSIRLAALPEASAWREQGVRIINDAVHRQILTDGAHMEATPGYHGGVMTMMTYLWRLSRAMPELGLKIPVEKIAAMHDYALHTTRPDGHITPMHDTRYPPPVGGRPNHTRHDREAFRKLAGLPPGDPEPCRIFPDAMQVYLRDHWGTDATYIAYDATRRRSFHWHPGRNTIQLSHGGRSLLVDTGYPFASKEFPKYGHRTAHHSTVNLNGFDQSDSIAQLRYRTAPGYDLVEGLYDGGYWPIQNFSHGTGVFGEHHRSMLWVRGRFLVVLDQVWHTSTDGNKPDVETVWQFSEGPLAVDQVKRTAVTGHGDANVLMLFPLVLPNTVITKHEGERDPMRGWVTTEWGRACSPAPMLRVTSPKFDPWNGHMATVIVPFKGATPPRVTATSEPAGSDGPGREAGLVTLQWEDGTTDRIIWTRRLAHAINAQRGVDTDASLVHMRHDAKGAFGGGLAVDGRFIVSELLGGGDQIAKLHRC